MRRIMSYTNSSSARAFTLVELLAVMAIVALMAVLSVPAFSGLLQSGSVNQTVAGISLTLDQARAYAMAHNTYVWVGFYQDPAAKALTMGAVAGTSGLADDLNSSTTYTPITRLQIYPNFALAGNLTFNGMASDAIDISASVSTFQQQAAGGLVKLSTVVQFNPSGEACFPTAASTSHWIQIGLQPARGNQSNDAVIQLATLTGQVAVFRR
jgi:prepilin-type N-terminal cleavage/methylation domain-containing protein